MTNIWTWSRTASSNATADGSLWPENQLPSTVNNSARDNMASVARHRDDVSGMLVTAGTSNAYTLTSATTGLTLVDGLTIAFRADRANTGAATLAVDSAAAKNLKKLGGTALASGDIVEGAIYRATYYQSADEFRLHSSAQAVVASAVAFTPAGTIAASTVQAAIEEVASEKAATSHQHVIADITDYTSGGPASGVAFTPAGNIEATNVQAAIQELDTEKAIAANFATTSSPQFAGINVGHETDTTVTRAAAGVLAVEGKQLLMSGKHTIEIPAGAMKPGTTSGAASATVEAGTNDQTYPVLDFDASADESAHFNFTFPKSWNEGTITFAVTWTTTATGTTGVAWGLQAVAVGDGDTIDASWGTPVVVTDDAQSAAGDVLVTAESSAVTIAGTPAAGKRVFFRIFRDVSDGNDDMTEDARLIGATIYYTIDAATDA